MKAIPTNKTIYMILRAVMILFWVYVGIEKLWQPEAFKIALQQQPLISMYASVLFWLLPLSEVSIGLLLGFPTLRLQAWGWRASMLLITLFSIYIGLGVLNVYDRKPCMCASFLSNISWTKHLLVNSLILIFSLAGWLINRSRLDNLNKNITAAIPMALLVFSFLTPALVQYSSIPRVQSKYRWILPDSLYQIPAYDSVSRPIVGSLAYRYDRYTESYRHYLFTNSMQANSMTNQLLACSAERRVALC
ncbi:MauE/DoxX family redox-associated membrane protein [Sphingobacterium sp. UGAL515B_05]|uniref:MauE/DoxX family redox-associated membrane protein n=1 Tax=Sphingobacterium sp. UGAL515B_05 TaxID=2986767 RepID=UPI002954D4B1|nr:MauE/DoxX family redox-associated membrane protein [Sphingobacterium sp. UGAL515B_05]WON95048.1 hypothetical protein OK025_01220 [Sphingobacterium sp. UGAL515B_05]